MKECEPVVATTSQDHDNSLTIYVRLLGRFQVTAGDVSTGHWPRPSARRLCQLLFISPGRRVRREAACDALFPSLAVDRAAHALYTSQSMARLALGGLGLRPRACCALIVTSSG